jgi:diacylglycerol kinase (ATP)
LFGLRRWINLQIRLLGRAPCSANRPTMQSWIIFNPRAGSAEQIELLRSTIGTDDSLRLCETTSPGDVTRLTLEAIENRCPCIVAAGGDGTIHEVANVMLQHRSGATLGMLPLGTGNDLCRTLGIPTELPDALQLLKSGQQRRISAIKVTCETGLRFCINVAAGGFSGQLDEALTDEMKQMWGPLAYLRGAIKVIPDLTHYRTAVRFDGKARETIHAINIIIANGRTAGGGRAVAPMANPEDYVMDVVIVRPGSFTELAGVGARLLAGDYTDSELVTHRTARRVEITSEPGMWFNVDGELLTNKPITFTLLPDVLTVITGQSYSPTST